MMLGCQDFCGYYDWTFNYVRRRFGNAAVEALWAEAIGAESQRHYADAAAQDGLPGLLRTWTATGEDEQCDWTFTLDQQRNVLRWDMRSCPSKGYLLQHDLVQDVDYCDHCMGWIVPLLGAHGIEVAAHEHNHAGQCWTEMRIKDRPTQSPATAPDIRHDPRWQRGYVERWEGGVKLPVLQGVSESTRPQEVLRQWFARYDRLLVLDEGHAAAGHEIQSGAADGVLVSDSLYAKGHGWMGEPAAVLIAACPRDELLALTAKRWLATAAAQRPLLLHAYLPRGHWPAWASHGLPRPLPILPLLIESGLYRHEPGGPWPSSAMLLHLLATALDKPTRVVGGPSPQRPARTPA